MSACGRGGGGLPSKWSTVAQPWPVLRPRYSLICTHLFTLIITISFPKTLYELSTRPGGIEPWLRGAGRPLSLGA